MQLSKLWCWICSVKCIFDGPRSDFGFPRHSSSPSQCGLPVAFLASVAFIVVRWSTISGPTATQVARHRRLTRASQKHLQGRKMSKWGGNFHTFVLASSASTKALFVLVTLDAVAVDFLHRRLHAAGRLDPDADRLPPRCRDDELSLNHRHAVGRPNVAATALPRSLQPR